MICLGRLSGGLLLFEQFNRILNWASRTKLLLGLHARRSRTVCVIDLCAILLSIMNIAFVFVQIGFAFAMTIPVLTLFSAVFATLAAVQNNAMIVVCVL